MKCIKGILTATITLAALPAAAQPDWPSRPLRLVVPTGAGSPIDTLARAVSQQIQEKVGQSIVVENRPGANQIIGMDACARAAPDGYTFCIANNNSWTINPLIFSKLPYDPARQLTPVAILAWPSSVITAHAALGVKSMRDAVELSKREPSSLNWGSTGTGSNSHFYHDAITKATGWEVEHVPYANVGHLVPAALANTVQVYYGTIGSVKPHIDSGKLVPLAVVTAERTRFLPDVPTMKEAGLGDFHMPAWFGMVAPQGTPPEVVEKMNRLIDTVVKDETFRAEFLDPQTLEPGGGTVAEFAAYLEEERRTSQALVESAKIRLD